MAKDGLCLECRRQNPDKALDWMAKKEAFEKKIDALKRKGDV